MKRFVQWGVFVLVIFLLFAPFQSNAFWSFSPFNSGPFNIHRDIDNDAFRSAYPLGPVPQKLEFSVKAKDEINKYNAKQDTVSYAGTDHFDSAKVQDSFDVLRSRYGQLGKDLKAKNQIEAWKGMGQMLHAVQDFYSHSTWVWKGRTAHVDFGSALYLNQSIPSLLSSWSSVEGCALDDDTSVFQFGVESVTTGFYPDHGVSGSCFHGPPGITGTFPNYKYTLGGWGEWYFVSPDPTPESVDLWLSQPRPGIALDYPGDKRGTAYNGFVKSARQLAREESELFLDAVVKGVKEKYGICAACLLTDQQDTQYCIDASKADPLCNPPLCNFDLYRPRIMAWCTDDCNDYYDSHPWEGCADNCLSLVVFNMSNVSGHYPSWLNEECPAPSPNGVRFCFPSLGQICIN